MRLLVIGMGHSVHTARWLEQLSGTGWDVHFVPVDDAPFHREMTGLTVHSRVRFPELAGRARQVGVVWPFVRGRQMVTSFVDRLPGSDLARVIRRVRPDVIHALQMQHAGYRLWDARDAIACPVIYSSWGSDIYFYGRLPEHAAKIRNVLSICDYYISDCQRDVGLAHEFGFRGETLGVFPVCGGFDGAALAPLRQSGAASARRSIAVKGYHHEAGRALTAMHALLVMQDELREFDIEIFSATTNTLHVAEFLRRVTGLRISLLPPSGNDAVLQLLGRARAYIGLSITDGTPVSMLEAMLMGALPIQSDTVSTAEWIRDGENGLLVPPEDVDAVVRALRRALRDDALVDRAQRENVEGLSAKLDRQRIREQVIAAYARVAAG